MRLSKSCLAALAAGALSQAALAQTAPQYTIVDLGVIGSGTSSATYGISAGGVIAGRSLASSSSTAFTWTQAGGVQALSPLAGAGAYDQANGANDAGVVVGSAAGTATGSGAVAVMWVNGQAQQLATPTGYANVSANAVNASNVAVGTGAGANGNNAIVFANGGATAVGALSNGGTMAAAYGINDAGWAVGYGLDPSNSSQRDGLVYNTQTGSFISLGTLSNKNGSIAYGVSDSGFVVGAAMQNAGGAIPFVWTQAGGMQAVPLLSGDSLGTARGVNDSGLVVGTMGIGTLTPFLYDNGTSYALSNLIPANSGWTMNSSISTAYGISDNGVITGTAILNGAAHAYALVPVPEPDSYALLLAGLGALGWIVRRRTAARA